MYNKVTLSDFILKAKKVHNDKYKYSKVDYQHTNNKVCIICSIHGEFWQTPHQHIQGRGCPKCAMLLRKQNHPFSTNEFILKANQIHNFKYDYIKVCYVDCKTNVCIICPDHGEFWQNPHRHLQGCGCPRCYQSKGEKQIERWLKENNVVFIPQKRFKKCKSSISNYYLSFDFYLPEINTCIEYDGRQHFMPVKYFGGAQKFQRTKINDQIKNIFCLNNKITLIRISYKDNIKEKLLQLNL